MIQHISAYSPDLNDADVVGYFVLEAVGLPVGELDYLPLSRLETLIADFRLCPYRRDGSVIGYRNLEGAIINVTRDYGYVTRCFCVHES